MNKVSCSSLIFLISALLASGKDILLEKTHDFKSLLDGNQNMNITKITKAIEGFMKKNTEPINMPPLSVAVTVNDVIIDGLKNSRIVFTKNDDNFMDFEINLENVKHYGRYLINLKYWKILEAFSKNVTLKKMVLQGSILSSVPEFKKPRFVMLPINISFDEVMFDIDGNKYLENFLNKHFVDLAQEYGISQILRPWVEWDINTFLLDDDFPKDVEGQVKKLNKFFKDAIEKMPEVIKINTLVRGDLELENMQLKPNSCIYQELKHEDSLSETRSFKCQQLTLSGDFNFVFNGGIVNETEWVLVAVGKNNTHVVADQFEVSVSNAWTYIQKTDIASEAITLNISGIINNKDGIIDKKVNNFLNTEWPNLLKLISNSASYLLNFIIEVVSADIEDNKIYNEIPTSSGFANFVSFSKLIGCCYLIGLPWLLKNV